MWCGPDYWIRVFLPTIELLSDTESSRVMRSRASCWPTTAHSGCRTTCSNTGKQNIISHPFDFEEDGGGIVFNLPNGFQAYYICDAEGGRLDMLLRIVKDDNPGFEESPS